MKYPFKLQGKETDDKSKPFTHRMIGIGANDDT